MSQPRLLFLLHCKGNGRNTYYSNGVSCLHIPFESFTEFTLQVIRIEKGFYFIQDRLPALKRFQRAWRRRLKWLRAPKRWLIRQQIGMAIRPPPFLEEEIHHELNIHLPSSFVNWVEQ